MRKRDKTYFWRKNRNKGFALAKTTNTSPRFVSQAKSFPLPHNKRKKKMNRSGEGVNFKTTLIQLWKRLRIGEACQVAWADSDPQWDAACVFQPCDDSARKWGQARPMRAQACSTLRSHWSRAVCHQRWSVWESFSRDTGGEAGIRLAGVVTNYFNCFTTAHNCSKLIHKCKEQLLRNCAQLHTYFHNCSKLTVAKNNSFATAHNCTQIFTSAENCLTIARCRDSSAHAAWTSAFNGSV